MYVFLYLKRLKHRSSLMKHEVFLKFILLHRLCDAHFLWKLRIIYYNERRHTSDWFQCYECTIYSIIQINVSSFSWEFLLFLAFAMSHLCHLHSRGVQLVFLIDLQNKDIWSLLPYVWSTVSELTEIRLENYKCLFPWLLHG